MTQTIGQQTVLNLLHGTAAEYDRLVDESTLGLDGEWKAEVIDLMEDPRHVLDLASGTGIVTFLALDRFPNAHVTGVDLQSDYLAIARQRATQLDLEDRTDFHCSAVEDFDGESGTYDHIISCYLPKYADLDILVLRLRSWSAPGARIILHDFTHPLDPMVEKTLQKHHDRWLQRAERCYPNWVNCFRDLYDVVRRTDWSTRLPALLGEAGFEDIQSMSLSDGCACIVTARAP